MDEFKVQNSNIRKSFAKLRCKNIPNHGKWQNQQGNYLEFLMEMIWNLNWQSKKL